MKTITMQFLCGILFVSCTAEAQQKQLFDIIAYDEPAGWQPSSTAQTLTFSKEDQSGHYCTITLSKSAAAEADAEANFNRSWQTIAMNNLGAGAATMQPGTTDNGWKTLMGSAPFEKGGLKGAAILVNSSKNNKMVNILVLTNTDKFQKEIEAFLESVTLKHTGMANTGAIPSSPATSSGNAMGQPELWINIRYMPGDFYDVTEGLKAIKDFFVVYPSGDYYPAAPHEGLHGFDKSYHPGSWGKFTMQGTKGRFKNRYDDIPLTKKSATYMQKDGYTHGFYKASSVDGLRLEGAYTHVSPGWGKDPRLNYLGGPGCQFVIYFKKDGTFDDRGAFSSRAGGCESCNCQGGKGKYSIERFTITFQYDDGRVVHRLFSAPPNRNPATYNDIYIMGTTGFYKKQ